ncbi:hypothetical protein Mapa_009111 [Marchantia paleacea]|nr:hypothetical protein Mapa_009111 [Marchantia paleacea]
MLTTRLKWVLVVVHVLTLQTRDIAAANFSLGSPETPFKCNLKGNMWCGGEATTSSGTLALTPVYDANKTDVNYMNTYGVAVMSVPGPVVLLNTATRRWDSFRTSFRFIIEASASFGPGDGMTFMMLNVSQYPGSAGNKFGLYNDDGEEVVATLAVEFDTFKNENNSDINGNHVGLDLKNSTSVAARSAADAGIYLASGRSIYSWIDYDSSAGVLEVRISLNDSRPAKAFFDHPVDLFDVFHENPLVYVGFSASNGFCFCHSFYTVYDWTFESFPSHGSHARKALVAGIVAGTMSIALVLFVALFILWWKRRSAEDDDEEEGIDVKDTPELVGMADNLRFSYKELSAATGQFREDSKLGQGGFGSVYRGLLPSTGEPVAVKRVSNDSKQGLKEFVAEVSIISQLRHRNIVRLLGWCSDRNKFLLVYELMPNGSLDKALFSPPPDGVLPWKLRFQIIVGAAEALHYLHEGWRRQIIHRDFKSSNIMLNEEFSAMLGDFGLARMVDRHENPATTIVAGTFGYIAPEVPGSGKFTEKTDVYAFGAVALEVACGRLAFNAQLAEEERVLVDWVWKRLDEGELLSVVDPKLEGQYDAKQVQVLLLLGLLCSHPNPDNRPSMTQVLEILAGSVAIPPVPSSKPAPEYHSSGREFRMDAMNLIFSTDTLKLESVTDMDSSDRSITRRGSDPLIMFSKSSTESTSPPHVSDPLIEV